MIAFSGLSGSGKSTLARILAPQVNGWCISEPEENAWPTTLRHREKYGPSLGLLALRNIWAQQYSDADALRKEGKIVFLDSYFFKINNYYLDKPGMGWLIPGDDPYLPLLMQLSRLDQIYFPDVDCVILLDIRFEDWKLFIQARGREFDKLPGFADAYSVNKKYIEDATITHCAANGIRLIRFEQTWGDPVMQAQRLKELLIAAHVIKI